MINKRYYPDLDLMVHTVVGPLDVDEFRRAGQALYEMDPVPLLSLWNLSRASLSEFTVARIRGVQAQLAGSVRDRKGGRTAVVVPGDFDFGVTRQYLAYAEDLELPFQQATFRSLGEALTWLDVDPAHLELDGA